MLEAPEETARAVLGLLEDAAPHDRVVPARTGRSRPRRASRGALPARPVP
jgi:hypothetical protein